TVVRSARAGVSVAHVSRRTSQARTLVSLRLLLRAPLAGALLVLGCGTGEQRVSSSGAQRVQASGSTADALAAAGATVVEDYGGFTILEATPEQMARLPPGARIEQRDSDSVIRLNSG